MGLPIAKSTQPVSNSAFITSFPFSSTCKFKSKSLSVINSTPFLANSSLYFFTLAICQKVKYEKWELIIIIATVIIGSALKLINQYVGLVFDVWQFIIMPCVFTIKTPKKHWNVIIANVLLIVFQFASAITKNIGINIMSNNSALVSSIYSIDVILMVLLYFGYANFKKEK